MWNCRFCLDNELLEGEILAQDDHFYFVESIDPILRHAGMVIPKRHVRTPFELTDAEWGALKGMVEKAKTILDTHEPDGYNIGWNVGEIAGQNIQHAHLHIIARFADEPLAYKGIRYAFRQETNKRRSDM